MCKKKETHRCGKPENEVEIGTKSLGISRISLIDMPQVILHRCMHMECGWTQLRMPKASTDPVQAWFRDVRVKNQSSASIGALY